MAAGADDRTKVSEGSEKVVRVFSLDFVEVVEGLAAGLDGGGENAGFLRLADIAVGVADAA